MKVLMCNSFYYVRGGAERCFLDLIDLLESYGHEVIPFSMQHEKNFPSPYSDYFISFIDYPSLLGNNSGVSDYIRVMERVLYSREAYDNITRLIEDTKPDIAHIHGIGSETSPSILRAIKKAGIPIVQTLHDYRLLCPAISFFSQGEICESCKKRRYHHVLKKRCKRDSLSASLMAGINISFQKITRSYEGNVDLFVAPSRFLKDKFLEYDFKNPIVHLPNFVNLDQFQPCYEKENYFVFYGTLSKLKGVFTMLEAMKEIPDSHLYIAGHGDTWDEMNDYIADNKLKNVTMLGYLGADQLIPLVQKAMFSIVPSIWYENYSMSVLEALACATPVIGSRVGGIPEQVTHGWNGLLFELGNAQSLAEQIRYMLDNPEERMQMSQNARLRIEESNDPEAHYNQTMNIYRSLLNQEQLELSTV
jgi:glycosyltransferase involved in cell wall biosynthesis